MSADPCCRLLSIRLDEGSFGRAPPAIEHERAIAIYDLLEENSFALKEHSGPYRLTLQLFEQRLVFDIRSDGGEPLVTHLLSLTPFRKVIKDYALICDSYRHAIRSAPPSRIEAIDMGRRAVHNEGSQILRDRLDGKVDLDLNTARRLFTLICALHWRA